MVLTCVSACTDSAGNLHIGAGAADCRSGDSEGGVSSDSISQSGAHQIRSGPDNVLSLLPGGESARYHTLSFNVYGLNIPRT